MSGSEPALDLCDFTTQTPWERFSADIARHLRAMPAAAEAGGVYRARLAANGLALARPTAHFDLVGARVPASGAAGTIAPNARDLFAPDVVQHGRTCGAHFGLYRCSGPAHDAFRPRWCVELRSVDVDAGIGFCGSSESRDDVPDARDVPLLLSALVCGANDALLADALLAVTDARGAGAAAGYQLAPRGGRHGPLVAGTERVPGAPERLCFLDGLFRYTLGKFTAVGSVEGAVAVQFLYVLRSYVSEEWREPLGFGSLALGPSYTGGATTSTRATSRTSLPWGPEEDPVEQLSLALQWQGDHPGEDTQAFSEYDSLSASRWVLRAGFAAAPRTPPLLAAGARGLLRACRECAGFASVAQITGTSHVAAGQTVLTCLPAADGTTTPAGAREESVATLLDDVFREAAAAGGDGEGAGTPRRNAVPRMGVRGTAPGSLLERLALCVLAARRLKSFMVLWLAFVARVRATIERGEPLPGTGNTPRFSDCLIEQKLCSVCASLSCLIHLVIFRFHVWIRCFPVFETCFNKTNENS